jgi:hypothetical protein
MGAGVPASARGDDDPRLMTDGGRTAKADIDDPELLAALEKAEEEHGSMAEALRHAVRTTYVETEEGYPAVPADIPRDLRAGYAALIDRYGTGSRVAIESAKSVIAQATKTPAEETKRTVIEPLRQRGYLGIHTGIKQVGVFIPERPATDGGHSPDDCDANEADVGDDDAVTGDDGDRADVDAEFNRLESAEIDRGEDIETDGGEVIGVSPITGVIYAAEEYDEAGDGRITATKKRPLPRAEIGERLGEVHGPVRRAYREHLGGGDDE